MEFTVLLDAPSEPKTRIQIAKLGDDFEHGKYGRFAITSKDVDSWRENLAKLPGGRALIDLDHQADRTPRRTEAAGWITGVSLDGNTPMADVEWTPTGEQAIKDKRYLFFSPTFGPFKDEHGGVHDNVLQGGALTNKPFLSSLPMLTLASEERVSEALDADPAARFYTRALDGDLGDQVAALVLLDVSQAERDTAVKNNHALPDGSYPIENEKQLHAAAILAASGHGNVAGAKKLIRRRAKDLGVDVTTLPGFGPKSLDSRRPMDKALLTALDLDGDTDLVTALDAVELDEAAEKKILDAVTALKAEPRTLEQQAKDSGLVLLDADTVKSLQQQAARGEAAAIQLHEQRFETAFDQAVKDRKVIPAERDSLHRFFELDADAALKSIDDRQAIMPDKPRGNPAIELDRDEPADPAQVAAAGLHPGQHETHRKVLAKLKELSLPESKYTDVYVTMLEAGEL